VIDTPIRTQALNNFFMTTSFIGGLTYNDHLLLKMPKGLTSERKRLHEPLARESGWLGHMMQKSCHDLCTHEVSQTKL
jgi:hypothetical protein